MRMPGILSKREHRTYMSNFARAANNSANDTRALMAMSVNEMDTYNGDLVTLTFSTASLTVARSPNSVYTP